MGLLAQVSLQLQQQPVYIPLLAAFACVLALVLFISWLRTRRAYHRLKQDLDKLKQEFEEVQKKYDREVLWRMAGEKKAPEVVVTAPSTGIIAGTEAPAHSHAQ